MSRALAGEDRAKARARRADRTGIARDLRGLRRRLEPYLLVGPAVVVLTLFFVWRVIYNLLLSFQSVSIFELGRGGRFVGLQNYADLLRDRLTLLSVQNTVFWLTLVTVASRLILGVGLALLLNATVLRRWRLSGLARTLLLIPWITPPVVAAWPGVVVAATYAFISAWDELLIALTLMTQEEVKTVPVGMAGLIGEFASEWNLMMAASTIAAVPTLILFLALQRRLVSELAAGSVKQ